jgi:protein-tyrosine phosphatase
VEPPSSGGRSGSEQVLFVCVANVCRSPYMEFQTSRGLYAHGIGSAWGFSSAGTDAAEGQRMCSQSAKAIRDVPGGWDFATSHRSRPLTTELVEGSALILVASQRERSVVVGLSAAAQARTFTMLEAAHFAGIAVAHAELMPSSGGRHRGPVTLEEVVNALHLSRGLPPDPVGPQETSLRSRLRLPGSRRPDDFDVADAHGEANRRHAPVLTDLSRATGRLVGAFADLGAGDHQGAPAKDR